MSIRTALSRQRGLASVELALISPFLLVMMLVAAEFTRAFYQYNILTKGVRDAARYAANEAYPGSAQVLQLSNDTKTGAENIAKTGTFDGSGPPVLDGTYTEFTVNGVEIGTAPARDHVRVTAVYEYRPLSVGGISRMGFLSSDIDTNFTLRASSTMRAIE